MIYMFQGRYVRHLYDLCDLYDLKLMLPGGSRKFCAIQHMLSGWDLYDTDIAQSLATAGGELDNLDHDLSVDDLSEACKIQPRSTNPMLSSIVLPLPENPGGRMSSEGGLPFGRRKRYPTLIMLQFRVFSHPRKALGCRLPTLKNIGLQVNVIILLT